ncbi:MAG: hypothetical protein ACUVRM_06495 [Bacillota bacterium]
MSDYDVLLNPQRVTLGPAPCAVDLGDGSERGEYVNQDYILRTLGRPHRSINLMYCYWPKDEGWPRRASEVFSPSEAFVWSYPYDDYFPYQGGPGGDPDGEPFRQIRDIRRHGQDVTLTLTIDCSLEDYYLKAIAKKLKPFGRLRLRLNHECDGDWFTCNKRFDRRQISAFFCRFHEIIKATAPEIQTICCFGTIDEATGRLRYEDDLVPMLRYADIWSVDKYLSLHYAWPFNICKRDQLNKGYSYAGVEGVWREIHRIYEIFVERSGQEKPFEICEFNADGDVAGQRQQARELREFYERVRTEKPPFLKGITYYQFRDRGRLGLEREDPNNPGVGIATPFLADYRTIIRDAYFLPHEDWRPLGPGESPTLAWRSAEDADGLGWEVILRGRPSFFELRLEKDANLMVQVDRVWYYKKPGVEWMDATDAVDGLDRGARVRIAIFAPPADGTLTPVGMLSPPVLRVRYES